jgi:ribosome-associated protein
MESIEIARLCAKYADEKKAEDILLLDLRGLSPVTDFFVIATANSNPQLRAVRDQIVEEMRDVNGLKPIISDGTYESQWLIVNYPNVLVHILSPEKREFYALDELWEDAPAVAWQEEKAEAPVARKRATTKKIAAKKAAPVKKAAAKKAAPAKKAAKKTAKKKSA